MFHPYFSFFFLSLFSLAYGGEISVTNGGKWGVWGPIVMCPDGYVVKGFAIKVEAYVGKTHDDSAVNGLRLYCLPIVGFGTEVVITSSEGPFGLWLEKIMCPNNGFIKSFCLKVEPDQGSFVDDTTVNNVKVTCSGGEVLEGSGLQFGTYGTFSNDCQFGVCGISNKVESYPAADYTGLNDSKMYCCL